jgi:hypothetical protein
LALAFARFFGIGAVKIGWKIIVMVENPNCKNEN